MNSYQTNQNPYINCFYTEFSTDKKGEYKAHFSFKYIESAEKYFAIMKNEWKLPVELSGNRIILSRSNDTNMAKGITTTSILTWDEIEKKWVIKEMFIIKMTIESHANDFLKLLREHAGRFFINYGLGFNYSATSSTRIERRSLLLDMDIVRKPEFSIAARVRYQNTVVQNNWTYYLTLYDALQQNLPKDVVLIIMYLTTLVKDTRYQKLNNFFGLHNQQVNIRTDQTITCSVSYAMNQPPLEKEYVQSNPYVFLTCNNSHDASILYNQMQIHTSLNTILFSNEVIISTHFNKNNNIIYGASLGYCNQNIIALNFKYKDSEPYTFLDFVKFQNLKHAQPNTDYAMVNFQKNALNERIMKKIITPETITDEINSNAQSIALNVVADINKLISDITENDLKIFVFTLFGSDNFDNRKEMNGNLISCLNILINSIQTKLSSRVCISLDPIIEDWKKINLTGLPGGKNIGEFIQDTPNGKWIMEKIEKIACKYNQQFFIQPASLRI